MKHSYWILKTLAIITLFVTACGTKKNKPIEVLNIPQVQEANSANLEEYLEWTEKVEYIKPKKAVANVLSKHEKERDTVMLLKFLKKHYRELELLAEPSYATSDLLKFVYAIDINDDGMLDIIYNGPTGGESNIMQVFLQKSKIKYQRVFVAYQDIINMTFAANRLSSFTLLNIGCCADPQVLEYNYAVEYVESKPNFQLKQTIGYLNLTEKPQIDILPSKEFTITSQKARLRSDCYLLDSVEHPIYGSNGNMVAMYNKGAKGRVFGTKKDGETEWIYVIMSTYATKKNCNFPMFNEQSTNLKGWLLKANTDYEE
ncbi:MAG: hypothetical protein ACRC3G_01475 [Bacteroidales bacterium]